MGSIIRNPVILPGCGTMMDKGVIVRYLLDKETNPFTREKLTVTELTSFNASNECKLKCNQFTSELENYLDNLDIKL